MKNNLKCLDCVHLIREFGDEPSLGGGVDNIVRCAVRPEVEEAIRLELKYYGGNGSPFSTWLCGQTGIDIQCGMGIDDRDEWEKQVEDLRDSAWAAVDDWMATLPTMIISRLNGSEAFIKEVQCGTGWTLRRESQIVEDVLWRAQKGKCWDYSERPDEPDILLHSYYLLDEKEEKSLEEVIEDMELDREYQLLEEAELPEAVLTGHFTFVPEFGFFAERAYHSAA